MMYRIELTRAAQRDLRALTPQNLERVDKRIQALKADPRPPGVEKLSAMREVLYRIRVGHHRVVYRIEDDILLVW